MAADRIIPSHTLRRQFSTPRAGFMTVVPEASHYFSNCNVRGNRAILRIVLPGPGGSPQKSSSAIILPRSRPMTACIIALSLSVELGEKRSARVIPIIIVLSKNPPLWLCPPHGPHPRLCRKDRLSVSFPRSQEPAGSCAYGFPHVPHICSAS